MAKGQVGRSTEPGAVGYPPTRALTTDATHAAAAALAEFRSQLNASPTLHQVAYGRAHDTSNCSHPKRAIRTTASFRAALVAVCVDADARACVLGYVKARLAGAADCYRIADIPGALVTPALPGTVPPLRFVFGVGDASCTLRDVQPLGEWASWATAVAKGPARLALELALHSGDARLVNHLALAIVREGMTVAYRGEHRLTEAELRAARATAWARVWAHLAGESQPLMGDPGAHPNDPRAVWVLVRFRDATGDVFGLQRRLGLTWTVCGCTTCQREGEKVWAVGAEIHHRSSGDRGYRVDPTKRREMLRWAGKLAGMATVGIEWGLFGWGPKNSAERLGRMTRALPGGARAARNCLEHLLQQLEASVRTAGVLRLSTRQRFARHPEHLAVYLLRGQPGPPRRGYGRLPLHGWRRTAEAFFGRPLRTRYADNHANREHAKVRSSYEAALRLIGDWRALAPPR